MQARSRKLLFDEPPIAIAPSAARILGLAEAVFLQQLHYRLHQKMSDPQAYKNHFIDGRYWVYWNLADLHKEVPLGKSADPYKRITRKLRDLGILLVEKHKQSSWDQTNYYSINYEALDAIVGATNRDDSIGGVATNPSDEAQATKQSNGDGSIGGNATNHCSKTSTQTSTENTTTAECSGQVEHLGEIDWSLIPHNIRRQISDLIPGNLDSQRCVDMLSARLERDAFLPKNLQIGSPIKWFKKALSSPDFSAADNLAAARQRTEKLKVTTDLASSSVVALAATQVRAQREREDAAVTQLAQLDERGRTALAAAAVEACRYPHFTLQIRDAVVRGDLPERPLAKMAVLKALKTLSSKGMLP